MPEKTFVHQLVARYVDPFCPGPDHLASRGHNKHVSYSTTVFTTPERAMALADQFRALIRARLKLRDDYLIDVTTRSFEVVE
jgi:hypothetical protein